MSGQPPNSATFTFLDYTSYQMTTATTVAEAYGMTGVVSAADTINLALVLGRANDPTSLLASNWATRQVTLESLNASGTLWSTYGAAATDYATVLNGLDAFGIPVLGDAAGAAGYVTSAESRTIWVSVTPAQFQTLFGQELLEGRAAKQGGTSLTYWEGSLVVPAGWNVQGLWLDTGTVRGTTPAVSNLSGDVSIAPPTGPLSIGNGLAGAAASKVLSGDIGAWFYDFPLTSSTIATPTIALIEPMIGTALPPDAPYTFQQGLDGFRQFAKAPTPGAYYLVAQNNQTYDLPADSLERSLDIGVIASAAPGSLIGLYAGSGVANNAQSNAFTAYMSAIWDRVNAPQVISSSFGFMNQLAPGSPFAFALNELFVDAALSNITFLGANNDFGSSFALGTGIANQISAHGSPYVVVVGGTSITTLEKAPLDPSVAASLLSLAMAGDPAMLWQLIAGGLTTLPGSPDAPPAQIALLESVWNQYAVGADGQVTPALNSVGGGDGGVDLTRPIPAYQTAFGLTPTTANPGGGTGRGAPDVAALAGGNMAYIGPPASMQPLDAAQYATYGYIGTSAATPLWASLTAQIGAIFADQGLPNPGYLNDLLYQAAAIAPPAFNDITLGNNVTSFRAGGPLSSGGEDITLTGFGYQALPGYDLTTGLGSPNGLLLARAMTTIAHAQMNPAPVPELILPDGTGGWWSGADQTLLVQVMAASPTTMTLTDGNDVNEISGDGGSAFAWTSRMAQATQQTEFDPDLVRVFDMAGQSGLAQIDVAMGAAIAALIDGVSAAAPQASLTSDFGFADFVTGSGALRIARPVAVATTAGGMDDAVAVVRVRQNGSDTLQLGLYRVDDLNGTIDGVQPGDAGYADLAAVRAYATTTGLTVLDGPGWGNYAEALIQGVDSGDLVAMTLSNTTKGLQYWAFTGANERVDGIPVGHLWNYGLNTWGWEDLPRGGDRDFNDLIVQLDFTSASGSGWIA